MSLPGTKKIVLLGLMSQMPVAGNVWLVLQYLLGFQRLGYDVYYVEAHGCTPRELMRHEADDGWANAASFLDRVLRRFDLGDRWAYHAVRRDGRCYGMSEAQLRRLYGAADLILNLHGGTRPLPEHAATGRLVYLSTDPVDVEVELHDGVQATIDFLAPHCAFFTWGLNHGNPGCRVPVSDRFPFRPSAPPVVLDLWRRPPGEAGDLYTTVGNWRQLHREVRFEGEVYTWSKHSEFLKILDLPARAGRRFELALSSYDDADRRSLEENGWRVRPAREVSADLDAYRRYLAGSRGELTVAKDQNVRLRSGWFSERSAQYLATGRPVITQETGFSALLPTGAGLFAFSTVDEIVAAIASIDAAYERHCRTAAEIAGDFFDYQVVLPELLSAVGLPARAGGGVRPEAAPEGVNLVGYLRTESGVGAAARRTLRALRRAGVPVALRDVSGLQVNRSEDASLGRFDAGHLHDINLLCADVELHYALLAHLGEEFFRGRYNVGLWFWEQAGFPQHWHDRFAWYDEIWVGSSFIASALAPQSPIPVVRIPPVLAVAETGSRERGRRRLGVPPEALVYLFLFDFHSHPQRKNPLAVVEAFRRAFAPSDPVRLVLKCVNERSRPEDLARLRRRAAGHPIAIEEGYWTAEEIRDLTAACDVYVSLHRSEGVGFTISDAMALGKPVIATGWSGNMDFMNAGNSYPVRYELVELAENVGPYRAGDLWAEPSIEHAAELMRRVFENPAEAAERGAAARREIARDYSEAAVAGVLRRRLEAIATRRRLPEFRCEARTRYRRYRQGIGPLREVVRRTVPAGETVLVVSKGDDELLRIEDRNAWHFPRGENGRYAGYYPADGTAAVAHLEALRGEGAAFLLLPASAFWWLEHYRDFARHLEERYRVVHRDEGCLLFALRGDR